MSVKWYLQWLLLLLLVPALDVLAAVAPSGRTINSVLLSSGAQTDQLSVTVAPGAAISAKVNATHSGSGTGARWRSTSWQIGGGAISCANHANFDKAGTDTVTFSMTAPATAGTYDARFIAYQDDACTVGGSAPFTLAAGVVVAALLDNSTVTADPLTVPADGTSTSTISVTLRDGVGNPVPGKTVALSALSGSSIMVPASGTTDAAGVMLFSVRDTVVEPVTYRATNTTDGVVLTQTATVNFAAPALVLSFNVVERKTDPVNGKIFTKIAADPFALDIVALRGGSIEPAFTGTVAVEVVDSTSGGGCASLPLIATFTAQTFTKGDKGRHTLTANTVSDAYRNARVRVKYPTVAPTVVACSADNFAIRPDSFTGLSVTHGDWQSPGVTAVLDNVTFLAGRELHKAGRNFTVSATAINGAAKPGITTNYGGTPRATLTACAGAACTSVFGTFSLGASFSAGQLASSAATYSEVGAFRLQLIDDTFASVDNGDGSTAADRDIVSAVVSVGRFVPDHFAVAVNAPSFNTACAAGAFTYVGQRVTYTVSPVITVIARSVANTTTALYTGAWWRLAAGSLTPVSQAARYAAATGMLDISGLPPTASDPAIATSGGGTGTLTFDSGTGIAVSRAAPLAPFDAELALAINVIDADNVAATANPVTFGAATPGSGIAFTAGKEMRFGRLRLQNAHGSQLVQMPLALQAQFWNGTAFVTNTADGCTAIAPANVALGNYRRNLSAGETTVSTTGTLSAGVGTVRLSAPGAANDGSVDVSINLTAAAAGASCTAGMPASTPANLAHLQGAWCGGTYTNDPTARATFGVYRSSDRVIFQRENY